MKTRTTLFLIIIFISCAMINSGYSKKDGIEGRTGSPLESNCSPSCHTGHPVNSGGGSITITSPDLINFVYSPGQTYTIEVTVAKPSVNLFGFAFEALQANGTDAGTFIHTIPTETWSKAANINGNIRTSATHQENAGISTNTKTFMFDWVAPTTNVGTVTFYAAGNAANGNGTSLGDYIYTTSQTVFDSLTSSGINSSMEEFDKVTLFPNPAVSDFNITYNAKEEGELKIEAYKIDGEFLDLLLLKKETPGLHTYTFNVKQFGSSGLLLIKVKQDNKVAIKKIFIPSNQ